MTGSETVHERIRHLWEKNPSKFSPEDYARGWPKPVKDGFELVPWQEGTDMSRYAFAAATEMLSSNPLACPLDVCDFALRLRRIYVLERLSGLDGLETDPHDPVEQNLVRHVENRVAAENNGVVTTEMLYDGMVAFLSAMSKNARPASKTEREEIEKRIRAGRATYIEDLSVPAMVLGEKLENGDPATIALEERLKDGYPAAISLESKN